MVKGDRQDRPEQARAGSGKPEPDRASDEEVQSGGDAKQSMGRLGLCGRLLSDRRRAGRRRGWERIGQRRRSVLARMLFLEASDDKVGVDANRSRVRARERAPEDASRPAREVVCLQPLKQRNG